MLLRITIWLVLGVFLLTGGVAQSQTTKKNKNKTSTINSFLKWRVIDGFRSAKFGMTEEQVLRAIAKDFKISKKKSSAFSDPLAQNYSADHSYPKTGAGWRTC